MKPQLLIIGLGNPGVQYERTRHNAGWWALDHVVHEFATDENWIEKGRFSSLVREGRIGTLPVFFVKPHTYMNASGQAVRKMIDYYKLPESHVLVLVDDFDLPLGELRFRKNGGPGTHNGLRSLVQTIGEGFARVRIGLGASGLKGEAISHWVLSVPSLEEREIIDSAFDELPALLQTWGRGEL